MKRIAVVTGGCRGIGREVSSRLAAQGRRVVVLDRDQDTIEGVERVIKSDVTSAASVSEAMARVVADVGPVDILINCVGASLHERKIDQIRDEDWNATFDLNVRSAFLCTRAVAAGMRDRRWGRIINISAVAGRTYTLFGGADFTAAKAALIGFTRQCALELAPYGVTVNVVAPGLTLSERVTASWEAKSAEERASIMERVPMGRPSTTGEQASAIVWLCGEEASYVSGACLDVNGAMFVA